MGLFEKSVKNKDRFETPKGMIGIEDLYDLPLTTKVAGKPCLDDIAIALHKQLKDSETISFVSPSKSSKDRETLQRKFDIVTHIIRVKVDEQEKMAQARANKELKEKLLVIRDRKRDKVYDEMDLEALDKVISDLP